MVYVKRLLLFLGVMGFDMSLVGKPADTPLKQTIKYWRQLDCFETDHNSRITMIQNKHNKKRFLVKQEMRGNREWHIIVAREALGAYVADSVDVPANKVEILPVDTLFPGKRYDDRPATIHTVVPGLKVNKCKKWKPMRISIQQYIKPAVPKRRWGLTYEVVRSMALHEDLPRIAALDTFIANGDRHRANFFYDEKSDHFFAIDLESSFKRDLASCAVKYVGSILKRKRIPFSAQEVQGLCVYANTLRRLLAKHTPNSLYQRLLTFAIKAGIMPRSGRGAVAARMSLYKESIEKNYGSCKKLILLLDQLMVKVEKEKEIASTKNDKKSNNKKVANKGDECVKE